MDKEKKEILIKLSLLGQAVVRNGNDHMQTIAYTHLTILISEMVLKDTFTEDEAIHYLTGINRWTNYLGKLGSDSLHNYTRNIIIKSIK